jgi:hypothetical protein
MFYLLHVRHLILFPVFVLVSFPLFRLRAFCFRKQRYVAWTCQLQLARNCLLLSSPTSLFTVAIPTLVSLHLPPATCAAFLPVTLLLLVLSGLLSGPISKPRFPLAASSDKWQTRPLVREGAPCGQARKCQTLTHFWSWDPVGARQQDRLTVRQSQRVFDFDLLLTRG